MGEAVNETFLTRRELALRWKVTEGYLRNMACKGKGPKVTHLGGNVRYLFEHVCEYERESVS